MAETELPLFELPLVLLPGELLPLHIFEERYKAMVAHSLERDEPFGIVFTDEDSGAADVGCTAAVADVLERFDDGRLNIVVAGGIPVHGDRPPRGRRVPRRDRRAGRP